MAKTLIKSLTASGDSELDFIDGTSDVVFDDTYPVYEFHFVNIHPASASQFSFQVDTGTNTNYNQAITSTLFYSWHKEDNSSAGMGYDANNDQTTTAGSGTYQPFNSENMNTNNDSSLSGILTLYDPSSSTYIKHFTSQSVYFQGDPAQQTAYIAGYINTTTAITRIQFKMASGNIDAGAIYMYGVS